MKKPAKFQVIMLIIIAATLCFIFSWSLPDIPTSKETSMAVTEVVEPVLEPIVGEGNVTDNLVRKLAHFAEFFLLGFEVLFLFGKINAAPLLLIMTAALTDETIQIFSERGSQVQDVWLDFLGGIAGMLPALVILLLIKAVRKRKAR